MTAIPGYFGKLAGAGDFVQRRLPPAFLDGWDRAFSRALAESRDRLGAHWQPAYLAGPVWRFLLAPGVCGAAAWAGAVGPATDRVGRCFPMVVAAPLATGTGAPAVLHDGERWYDAVERTLRAALGDRALGAEAFDARVAALALPPEPEEPTLPQFPAGFDRARRDYGLPLPAGAVLPLHAAWHHLAGDGCGLWWRRAAGGADGRLLVARGLPTTALYLDFLAAPAAVARGVPA
ncbi:type VI secretion system-associated protein TagF [Luteimonas sp. Y-2-2-4F]|nr:type VI secretion system-associated protein TagF [Luteimonas sp. Y-2-2-4F]MCD9033570.1 type VI secretion system-associated protein TagF [Luteimonas sp. Y-2-2-4F]